MRKTYAAGIVLGARSDTDDADGQVTPCAGVSAPSHERVVDALQAFVGDIEQVPPAYSAALVAGRRAYDMARGGEAVSLAARRVTIDAIEVTRYEYPRLDVVVRCGKGTYIRSLARDLGNRLGCGGYIAALRRTRVGAFDEAAALPLDADRATARAALLPVTLAVAELRRVTVSPAEVQRVRQGQTIRLPATAPRAAGEVALFDERGALVAVAEVDMAHDAVRPGKVFAGQE
jgi:tRNA pseudouridine55 synthase